MANSTSYDPAGTSTHGMTKTEAADILATYLSVRVKQRGLDDVELTHTLIAECVSEARYEKAEGTLLNVAGWVRPADQTIRTAYRRHAGLI